MENNDDEAEIESTDNDSEDEEDNRPIQKQHKVQMSKHVECQRLRRSERQARRQRIKSNSENSHDKTKCDSVATVY